MIIRIRTGKDRGMEVDLPDNMALEIVDSYRVEDNYDRKCRYHHFSLDNMDYEGMEFASREDSPEELIEKEEQNEQIQQAMSYLTDVQRRRLLMYAEGMTEEAIARVEGVNQKSVHESLEGARKKFKKHF